MLQTDIEQLKAEFKELKQELLSLFASLKNDKKTGFECIEQQ